jgi:hypothetical protein
MDHSDIDRADLTLRITADREIYLSHLLFNTDKGITEYLLGIVLIESEVPDSVHNVL